MPYLFTSESVSEGHPDKIADQLSDSILDAMLSQDRNSRVACETFVTSGLVLVGGEVRTNAYVEIPELVRKTILEIGYNKAEYCFDSESCGIIVTLHQQSPDIAQGVDEQKTSGKRMGAGDQGIMFGYASNETTPEYLPMTLVFAHRLMKELAKIRKTEPELMPYLRPDSKSQVTIEYDDAGKPLRVDTIVVSTQHDPFHSDEAVMQKKIKEDVERILIPRVIPEAMLTKPFTLHVNPTGKFVLGGPHGDAGLTGRKIIVDTYGGRGGHGGGAFSGKDPSKVDRSAAYAARHIAKNLVHAGVADEMLIQLAYAIGVPDPVSILVRTFGTAKAGKTDSQIADIVREMFDLSPQGIIDRFSLLDPIYRPTAAYGHFGHESRVVEKEVNYVEVTEKNGSKSETRTRQTKNVRLYPWEQLDYEAQIKSAFKL